MCHDRWRTVTRRTALALLPWLCLSATVPGCSPGGQASGEAAVTRDRLVKMRNLRGTGDPRRPGNRPSILVRQNPETRRP
jgi:hypothetical protein